MRSENFNEEAMEKKIKTNLEKGFTIAQIKIKLREEMIDNLKRINSLDARNVELSDQIDYMETRTE